MNDALTTKIHEIEEALGFKKTRTTSTLNQKEMTDIIQSYQSNDATLLMGDNLKFLLPLASHTPNAIDVCYIDAPYNTGSKLIYADSRRSKNKGVFGTHNAWLSFMLPRIVAGHALLKNNGIMAISIDDYEYAHLKILMDRVFGEKNFIGDVIVCRSMNGKGSKLNIATTHEHLLFYGKSKASALLGEPDHTEYDKQDDFGQYRTDGIFRKKGEGSLRSDRPNLYYPLYWHPSTREVSITPIDGWHEVYPVDSKGIERRWLWSKETAAKKVWQLYASKNGVVWVKNYAGKTNAVKRVKIRTIWNDPSFYTEQGTNDIKQLFGAKVFDTPKPIEFVKKVLDVSGKKNALILDFFAGSGTTAHAAAALNRIDGGSRKTISIETTDLTPSSHIALEFGHATIADITAYRLRLIKGLMADFSYSIFSLGKTK